MFPKTDPAQHLTHRVWRAYQHQHKNYRLSRFNVYGDEIEFVERRYARDLKELHKEWLRQMRRDWDTLFEMGLDV